MPVHTAALGRFAGVNHVVAAVPSLGRALARRYNSLQASDSLGNLKLAMDNAEKYYGIEQYIKPEEIAKLDDKSMLVYCSECVIWFRLYGCVSFCASPPPSPLLVVDDEGQGFKGAGDKMFKGAREQGFNGRRTRVERRRRARDNSGVPWKKEWARMSATEGSSQPAIPCAHRY